jgi:quinol monooxygenase YgiN
MNATSPLTIIAIATAVPGREAELLVAQKQLVAETVRERGCLRFELNQSLDDARVLIFVESWESEALWRAHMQGAALKRWRATGAANLIADFTLHRMAPIADGQSKPLRTEDAGERSWT